MGRLWLCKTYGMGLLWLSLVPQVACAEEIGATLSARYHVDSDMPAGYWARKDADEKYKIDGTIYVSSGGWRAAVNPYITGDSSPTVAGVYAGVGYSFGSATVAAYHHSCHNLDYGDANIPGCMTNGILVRWEHGKTFQPLW